MAPANGVAKADWHRNSSAADAGLHLLPGKKTLTFEQDQTWVKTPSALSFVDETRDVVFGYESPSSEEDTRAAEVDLQRAASKTSSDAAIGRTTDIFPISPITPITPSTYTLVSTLSPVESRDAESTRALPRDDVHPVRIEDLLCASSIVAASSQHEESLQQFSTARNIPPLYLELSGATLITPKYAFLLNHFKVAVGWIWFDVTDPDFTAETLRLVPFCPVLLYAVLALSAMHRSRVAEYDENEAEDYHEQCVRLLLPMLDDKSIITDGAFLATSTLLRFYEEVSAPVHGRDDARHLLGGYASVAAAQEEQRPWSGLRNAALWVHQRQDVFNAILNQRVPKTDLDKCGLDRSVAPADECIWAKRATCLVGDVVTFCFGPDAGSTSKYLEIKQRLDDWDLCKPGSFTPVYFRERDPAAGRYFPEICLLLDPCVVGLAYFHLALLLMAIFDPTSPRIGSKYIEGRERIREKVLHHIRILCGITISTTVPPGRNVATLAISQCGVWVTDPNEQEELLKVLRLAETEDAWPGGESERIIKEQWARNAT
ncbi:hypothetical protein NA57DRAFT_80616 [Rhizodiscina lignyota]|uniref:Uncharacterized protein n=1 Tax=Rhizodiscina lignyota TaxID=1504668 RepID=A0A9P4I9G1_9PEZI|nr:hypothetical protein NA57DRAFT_80616 [Rhizodiscina lignyota]